LDAPKQCSWQNSPAKTRVVFDTRLVHDFVDYCRLR
jgi:hypothetical protein